MARKEKHGCRGAALALLLLLTLSLRLSGCGSSTLADNRSPERSSTDVYMDYTNDEFGFTVQFPVTRGEDVASWGSRNGSLFTMDSFRPPPDYDPAVQGIAVPRTVIRVFRPDDWPRKIGLSEIYEEWQLKEILSFFLEFELAPLLMEPAAGLHPPIEYTMQDGSASAMTIFSLTNSERTIWCYLTVVHQDDGDQYSLAGIRETESEAVAAQASFRLTESIGAGGSAAPSPSTGAEPTYSDPRWPTKDARLLSIPEVDRWYNARERIGSYGTIAGPVASVAYLDNRVIVNIGADYPNPSRAQVVIWPEYVPDFQDILSDIDHGNAWISVTGTISKYDGVAEIDVSDGPTNWGWWREVR